MLQNQTAQRLRPTLRQGDLDGFCGVYSVLNAMTLMMGDRFDQKAAFKCMLRAMGSSFVSIAAYGCTLKQFERQLAACSKHMFQKRIGMHYERIDCSPDITLDAFWKLIDAHIQLNGPGSVLLGVAGNYKHWSCVRTISSQAMEMSDSGNLRQLDRNRVTMSGVTSARPFLLRTSHCYLLRINRIKL